jgi:iron complex outermembrane recepter protein
MGSLPVRPPRFPRCMNLRRVQFLQFCMLFALPLCADDPQTSPAALKSLSLEELSQIEVTSVSKEPQKAMQTAAAIYVITGEDIRRSGAPNIPEALRLAPGVEVARIDSNKWSIGIRGFGTRLSRDILVLMDGRTVYTTLFAGTYWEVQDTNMDDIDRIEVIRGPGGTIWGPNAVNGVINIITKNAKETQGFQASGGGGNVSQGFANFRYGGSNATGLSYRVYAKAFTDGPEYHPDGRNFDDWRSVQTGARMDWDKGGRDTFTLQGDLYDEKAGEGVAGVSSYTPPYSQTIYANALLSGGNILGRWKRVIDDGDDIQLQIYYDRTNRHEPNLEDLRNTFDVDFLQRLRAPGRQEISWGLGARVIPMDDPVVVSGLTFLPSKRTDYLLTAFLQDEIALVDHRLTLTIGTKLLRTNFTGVKPEPSARLAWTPSDRQTVWAAYTHALRTPSDAEENFTLLGYNPAGFFARFNPNPHFQPEQMNGDELGYRLLLGKGVYIDVAGFYNRYHDLFDEEITGPFTLEDNPPPPYLLIPAQFGNGLRGWTKGAEIGPEWRPFSIWRLRGSYSYLHMNVEDTPHSLNVESVASITGSSPQHQVTILSALDLSKILHLHLTYRYVSALPAQLVSAYSTGDARFAWQFKPQVELSLVGRNLLQPWHAEFGGDPGPLVGIKRSGYIELTWRR